MRKMALPGAILGGILVAALNAAPASAQATRTWVSGVGDDANPCSRTAPCKTFAGAISKTAGGGEINVLDPGGFGAVTIGKSLTIRSTFEAGVLVSGTNGIVISATAADNVILEGLDFEGLGTGLNGITVTGNLKSLVVVRCSINRFTQNGINFVSLTNGGRLTVTNSVITNNNNGVNVQNGGANLSATVSNSMIDGNTSAGLVANGATASINYYNSTITGSTNGVSQLNSGQIFSIGTSNTGSGVGSSFVTGGGAPNATLLFK
jgi:hypothetical protein